MWRANERVIAFPESEDSGLSGTVRHVDGERNYVILDNGDDGWFLDAQLRPLQLAVGVAVLVTQPDTGESVTGVLGEVDGDSLSVHLPQGEIMHANLGELRFPGRATKADVDERDWQVGDRVLARWGGDLF